MLSLLLRVEVTNVLVPGRGRCCISVATKIVAAGPLFPVREHPGSLVLGAEIQGHASLSSHSFLLYSVVVNCITYRFFMVAAEEDF